MSVYKESVLGNFLYQLGIPSSKDPVMQLDRSYLFIFI